ncbi:choice-of-anchor P family protein [Actinophytocola sp.]|jgi:hypothetical protein|uniref:choice-of-anchor P family protein n=1 Tax=Actinophytocola sp. TaxID=1872138 RepID=UPI002EDA21E4
MRMRSVRRGGALGAVVAASLILGAMPASAAPGDGSAFAAKVSVTLLGQPAANVGPLAPSNTNGPTSASVASINAAGLVTAGLVTSKAELNEETGEVHAQADLANVGIALGALSGKISAVNATCDATQAGTKGSSTLAGVSLPGVSVPVNPAPNTTIDLVLAKIIFNEQISGPDGSLTVNAVHVKLNALVGKGDVILAQAKCGPAAPPVPLASGLGLWVGLGLVGLAAIPVGGMVIRKRRTATAAA